MDLEAAGESARALVAEANELTRTVSSWWRFALRFKLNALLGATLFSLTLAAVIFIGGRRLFERAIRRDPNEAHPTYLARLSTAFWSTLVSTTALAVFLVLTISLYGHYNVLRGDIALMLNGLVILILTVFLVYKLANSILSPARPAWALVEVETRPAWRILILVTAIAFVTSTDFWLNNLSEILSG